MDSLTQRQWSLLVHWLILVLVVEGIMLVLSRSLSFIYLIVACLFLAGFILRVAHLYPGKEEPLILDISAVVFALMFAYVASMLSLSNMRFALIFSSSLIILPHIVYILGSKNP
ncbi:hypothetical protein ACFL1E_07265 [Candidatus Omnitrophota bacterium]